MADEQLPLGGGSLTETGEDEPEEFLPGYATREDALSALSDAKTNAEKVSLQDQRLSEQGRIIDQVLQTRTAGSDMAPPAEPEVPDFGDPVEDRAGFNERLGKYVADTRRHSDVQLQQQAAQLQENDIARGLWDEFATEYPEYENSEELVRIVAADEMNSRQLGPLAALSQFQRTDLKRAVKDRCDKFGGQRAGEEPEPSRTGGVSSGSGGKRPAPSRASDKPPPSLTDELSKIQREAGYD